jgi:hypothetical protein
LLSLHNNDKTEGATRAERERGGGGGIIDPLAADIIRTHGD